MADEQPGRKRRRTTTGTRKSGTKKTTIPTPPPASDEPDASTRSSSGSDSAIEIEPAPWTPPDQPVPADAELDDEPYLPAPAEPIEWTPERAGAIVRAGGFLLHTADGMSREPGGDELWRATEADVDAIAPPLSRILNRYAPARRLAGVSDETELAIGLMGYARRNLADRGRLVTAKRAREADTLEAGGTPEWSEPPPES